MGRQQGQRLGGRLRLSGTLVAEDPLHIGGEGLDPATDMPLARDGQGRLYIPGTSLAGAIRDAVPMEEGADVILWGAARRPTRGVSDAPSHASRVWIADALLADDILPEVRDGVGIDRRTGTAADAIKFDRLVLPPGTRIPLEIVVELRALDEDAVAEEEMRALALLGGIVSASKERPLRLGAAQTRGLGRVSLESGWLARRQRLDSRADMLELLLHGAREGGKLVTDLVRDAATRTPLGRRGWRIRIDWTATSPMMVKAAGEGREIAMLPLTTADRDGRGRRLVLPGSAIKGALRSQSERIWRTLRGNDAPDGDFQAQLEGCDLPVMLFGIGGPPKGRDRGRWRPGRAAVGVADCTATQTIPTGELRRLAAGSAQEWLAQSRHADDAPHGLDIAYHVAVDRWTGGAADGFLYQAVEPRLAWEPIALDVAFDRLPVEHRAAALALLLMLLRDLAEGWITLGFGGNRGYGEVQVQRVEIEGDDPRDKDTVVAPLMNWTPGQGWHTTDDALGAWLEEGWRRWRAAATEEEAA